MKDNSMRTKGKCVTREQKISYIWQESNRKLAETM